MRLGIVVATLRLQKIIIRLDETAAREFAYLTAGVILTMVGIHKSIAIDNLHQLGIYGSLSRLIIILGALAIDIRIILVDKHITEALKALV